VLQGWLTNKRFGSDAERMAKDADCIRFFEAYWPEPSASVSGLSQFEQLRQIALDPLHDPDFELEPAPIRGR
jgi:hypothetical protein